MIKVQGPQPLRKEFMLETRHQQVYIAELLARAGFKYIIGWKDVRGWGVYGVKNVEWIRPQDFPYVNLRH